MSLTNRLRFDLVIDKLLYIMQSFLSVSVSSLYLISKSQINDLLVIPMHYSIIQMVAYYSIIII